MWCSVCIKLTPGAVLPCVQVSAGFTLRVQANSWSKTSWLGDMVRLRLGHARVLGPYCQQLCCGWVQPPCCGFGKADFLPRVSQWPGCKSAGKVWRRGCPGLQEQHPGAGVSGVSLERLGCCEDPLETIWKSKSIPAQCRVSLIASRSAFNCNELYGSAQRGAEALGWNLCNSRKCLHKSRVNVKLPTDFSIHEPLFVFHLGEQQKHGSVYGTLKDILKIRPLIFPEVGFAVTWFPLPPHRPPN